MLVSVGPEDFVMLIERLVGALDFERFDPASRLGAYSLVCPLLEKVLFKVLGKLGRFVGGG